MADAKAPKMVRTLSSTVPADTLRERVRRVLQSRPVELALGVVICCNIVLVVLETDATAAGEVPQWIPVLSMAFLLIYCLESGVKIYVLRWKYFCDTWNVMDFTVICLDVTLNFLEVIGVANTSGLSLSAARIFRLARLVRVFRVLKQIWELKMLLWSFAAAARSIVFGMGMVLTMTMIWSVLAVQLIHPVNYEVWEGREDECARCATAFGSVWESHITIFQTIIAGDSWGTYAIPVIDRSPLTFVYFLCVLVSINLAMLNLILAVIVESAAQAKQQDLHERALEKEEEKEEGRKMLLRICRHMDSDESGTIDLEELRAGFTDHHTFAACMKMMGVFDEDVELLFQILDTKGVGHVPYKDLVDTISRMQSDSAHVILSELCSLRASQQESVKDFKKNMDEHFEQMLRESNRCFSQMLQGMSSSTKLLQELSAPLELEAPEDDPGLKLPALKPHRLNDISARGESSLICAMKLERWDIARAILQRPDFTQLQARDKQGFSCWHHAMARDQLALCLELQKREDFDSSLKLFDPAGPDAGLAMLTI